VVRVVDRILARHNVDPALAGYLDTILELALNVLLVVGILGYFGVETTSFAALVASVGVAIGAAWRGLLTNFAGGACILLLHPFRVGDHVTGRGAARSHRGDAQCGVA
jgi:small conductance mechanosensitive channel